MPIYEYRCKEGHLFEVFQNMGDDPPAKCPTCGKAVQRVFNPVAIHFKGSGFHNTDYGRRKTAAGTNGADSGGGEGSKSGGGEKKEVKKGEPSSTSSTSDD